MDNFHITVDEAYNRIHNEYNKDVTRLQLSSGIFGLIIAGMAAAAYFLIPDPGIALMAAIGLGFVATFCFALIFILPKQVGSAQRIYDTYPLVPAIIAEVNPRDMVLMALVDTNVDKSKKPRLALALRTVTKIEGHERKVGERVPAVAVSGRRSLKNDGRWDEISPMPIAWATPDEIAIQQAEQQIPENQWRRLVQLLPKLPEVQATPMNLLEI